MAKLAYLVALGCATSLLLSNGYAQATASASAAASGPVFKLIRLLPNDSAKVVDGTRVDPAKWPAIVSVDLSDPKDDHGKKADRCSGALVGPGVVLTAPHCLDPGNSYSPLRTELWIQVSAGPPVALKCSIPDEYQASTLFSHKPRVAQDYALCSFSVKPEDHLPPAEVVDQTSLVSGEDVLITGWGCRTMTLQGNVWGMDRGNDIDLAMTIADAQIETTPTDTSLEHGFDTVLASLTEPGKHPAVCPGDSGGPLLSGAAVCNQTAKRRVRAVNSWYDVDKHNNTLLRSRFAALSSAEFKSFATTWLTDNSGFHICGLDGYDSKTAPAGACRE